MYHNKTSEADLESKRGLFFKIGLAVSLSAALIVINYETPRPRKVDTTTQISGLELTVINGQNADSLPAPPPARPME